MSHFRQLFVNMGVYQRLRFYGYSNIVSFVFLGIFFVYSYMVFARKFNLGEYLFGLFVVFSVLLFFLCLKKGTNHSGSFWRAIVENLKDNYFYSVCIAVLFFIVFYSLSWLANKVQISNYLSAPTALKYFFVFYLSYLIAVKLIIVWLFYGSWVDPELDVVPEYRKSFSQSVLIPEIITFSLCILFFIFLMRAEPTLFSKLETNSILKLIPQGLILHLIPFLFLEFKCYAYDYIRKDGRTDNVFHEYFRPLTVSAAFVSFIIIAVFEAVPVLLKIIGMR